MTLSLTLSWWMIVPVLWTVMGLTLLELVVKTHIVGDKEPVVCVWAGGMVLMLATRFLP